MPGPGEVLVKNAVVAQNPSDWKTIEWGLVRPGDGVGSDFVGRIVALGQGVDDVKIGDRVSGWLLPESTAKASTAYREYSIIRSKPLIHIPDNVPDDEAATFFCATATAASGLRALLGFPLIAPYNRSLLVWGGSCQYLL
ncbi:hypothetical protein EWM64_g9214 [Hericium alpestre]|uniref:Alcohol dehydrogenase-like N-terminal domain-containing protein n=1 Tax=Hericium alpestre TaxID=135208 RepID=A0A4Y9ZL41_9AGAM|nr:hypothetical protein EWM64_g9214 [Hericium alpestre]